MSTDLTKAHARRYPRLGVRIAVDCTVGETSFRSTATTLSGGGFFLTRVRTLEPGQQVSLRFRLARRLPVMEAKAIVRYVIAGRGAAVEFTEIDPDHHNKLLRLLHQKTGDRRLMKRAPLATQVESQQCMSLAYSRDIGLGGMFVETENPLTVGSSLTVRFNLDQKDKVVTATAHVAYVIDKMGMGIFFTEIEPEDRAAIIEYVENLPAAARVGVAKAGGPK